MGSLKTYQIQAREKKSIINSREQERSPTSFMDTAKCSHALYEWTTQCEFVLNSQGQSEGKRFYKSRITVQNGISRPVMTQLQDKAVPVQCPPSAAQTCGRLFSWILNTQAVGPSSSSIFKNQFCAVVILESWSNCWSSDYILKALKFQLHSFIACHHTLLWSNVDNSNDNNKALCFL